MVIRNVLIACVVSFGLFGNVFADLNNGLVAYYPFDGNLNDLSGNGNTANAHGGGYSTGVSNQSFACNGTSDYIQIPDNSAWDFSNNFSISFWSKINNAEAKSKTFITQSNGSAKSNSSIYLGYSYEGIGSSDFYIANSNGRDWLYHTHTSAGLVNDLKYHHYSYLKEGDSYSIYIDGALKSTAALPNNFQVYNSSRDIYVCTQEHEPYANYGEINIDELRVYNRAISTSEIQQLYTNKIDNSSCRATYQNGNLNIPCVDVIVSDPFGGSSTVTYEVDMQYQNTSNPMTFELYDAKQK